MAARTATRTSRDVDGKRHLIGELLKDDICIDITKHRCMIISSEKHSRSRSYYRQPYAVNTPF